jgi:immune inhibitor A
MEGMEGNSVVLRKRGPMMYVVSFILTLSLLIFAGWMPAAGTDASPTAAERNAVPGGTEAAPAVPKLAPSAVGTVHPAGKHLVRPRPEVVQRQLRKKGKITPGMTQEQVRSAVKAYYSDFAKKSSVWVTPEAQERALQRGAESSQAASAATGLSTTPIISAAVQPVTAKILVLAVDFGGTDTFTYSAPNGSGCKTQTVTTTGPFQGQIPHPGPLDNNSVWYEPAQTANAKFYENLIFGYQGVGRVRMDLTDPTDQQPGINLTGYTVQDYYDHQAGPGNVAFSGTVEGWVTVDHSEGYYGAPNCHSDHDGGGPVPVSRLVKDALDKFVEAHPDYYYDTSPTAFWKQFDANGDGVVDSLWLIHAGMGEEEGGGVQGEFSIWSHSSALWPRYKVYEGDPNTTADDIYVYPYTMQPEDANLGVLAEECGHNLFGLPDLYSADIENSVGFWSIMSAGTWAGWLGGASPVGMPLWFRMMAYCGSQYCNWHLPILSLPFTSPMTTVKIGQLENTPDGAYKGVKVDLPAIVDTGFENRAGLVKGAYTGTGRDSVNLTLDRNIYVSRFANRLTLQAYWDIEEDQDYGYVMVKVGNRWTFLDDLDGVMRETNPNGKNLGHGLTGSGHQKLRFDFSPYRGKTITLRLRYKTDAANSGAGWWVDDIRVDTKVISQFENAVAPGKFPGFTNSSPGWKVVPSTQSYANFYLVEWRSNTKYDRMLKTAYATAFADADEWQVERVPYNIPGALLTYHNDKYNYASRLQTGLWDDPSIGPKSSLLAVDMNYQPMLLGDTGIVLDARRGSYDAALTLQPTQPFTINQIDTGSSTLVGPWDFPAKPAVELFDDAKGYYAGFYADTYPEGPFYFANEGGSAVIPAFSSYTTRITHFDGTPFPDFYGTAYQGSVLGTGNPGDDGVQCGVRVKLLSKSSDNTTAVIRVNPPETP